MENGLSSGRTQPAVAIILLTICLFFALIIFTVQEAAYVTITPAATVHVTNLSEGGEPARL